MSRRIWLAVVLVLICASPTCAGDATRGAQRFQALCGSCHSAEPAARKLGSHMKGIVGRKAASIDGLAYSTALKTSGWVWSTQLLETFLTDPKKALPGTTMMVAAANPEDRKDIIAYLATLR